MENKTTLAKYANFWTYSISDVVFERNPKNTSITIKDKERNIKLKNPKEIQDLYGININ